MEAKQVARGLFQQVQFHFHLVTLKAQVPANGRPAQAKAGRHEDEVRLRLQVCSHYITRTATGMQAGALSGRQASYAAACPHDVHAVQDG